MGAAARRGLSLARRVGNKGCDSLSQLLLDKPTAVGSCLKFSRQTRALGVPQPKFMNTPAAAARGIEDVHGISKPSQSLE
jgi:hypothetical protein